LFAMLSSFFGEINIYPLCLGALVVT